MNTSICPIGHAQIGQLSPKECLTSRATRIGLLVGGILALGVAATLYFTHVNAIAAYTTGAVGGALLLTSGITCLISPQTRGEKPHVVVIKQFSPPENDELQKASPLLSQVNAEFHSDTTELEAKADQYKADGTRVIYYYKPDGRSDGPIGGYGGTLFHTYTLCKEKEIPFGLIVGAVPQSIWAHQGEGYARALIGQSGEKTDCWKGLCDEHKIYLEGSGVQGNSEVARTNQLMLDQFFGKDEAED